MRETVGATGDIDPIDHYLKVVGEDRLADRCRRPVRFDGRRCRPRQHRAPRAIGDIIGIAFQVSDDIIDIASATGDSGKTPGTDLREGVHTLPVLYAAR